MPKNDSQDTEKQVREDYGHRLSPKQDAILKTSKEVIIKYIETGRVSVAAFDESFKRIYQAIKETVEQD